MPKKELRQCPVCGRWRETVSATCSIKCARQAFPQKPKSPDPTPEQIEQACAEIRATWSEDEARRRRVGGAENDKNPIQTVPAGSTRHGGLHNMD